MPLASWLDMGCSPVTMSFHLPRLAGPRLVSMDANTLITSMRSSSCGRSEASGWPSVVLGRLARQTTCEIV